MQNHCRCTLIVRSVRCTSYLHQHGSTSAAAEHSAYQNAAVGDIGVRAPALANSLCYVLAWLAVQLASLHRQLKVYTDSLQANTDGSWTDADSQ